MYDVSAQTFPDTLTDDELVFASRENNHDAFAQLVSRFSPVLQQLSQKYRQYGAEPEDLVQEGLLGLLSAVQTYHSGGGASFRTYASVCIRNRMLSVVRRLSGGEIRQNIFPTEEGEMDSFPELMAEEPETVLIRREEWQLLQKQLQEQLTEREYQVLMLHIGAYSYREIAAKLSIAEKAVDNALQRVRRKVVK